MKVFGFEISRGKAAPDIATRAQLTPSNPQGYMTPYFQDYFLRKISGEFYEALREGIPVIDGAIRRLISLNGTIKIIGDKGPLVSELEDFCLNVPVNGAADGIHQTGIHAFLENFTNETFEQGFSLCEYIATPKLDDIAELRVADSKDIVFRRDPTGRAEAWYRYRNPVGISHPLYGSPSTLMERIINASYGQAVRINGVWEEKLDPSNKLYFSINNENSDPYGVSIMRSMEFCAKLLVTMQNSLSNVWERFGDPSFHIDYKTNKRDLGGESLEERRKKLQSDFDAAIRAKRSGKSADFITAVNTDASIDIKVIGHENQVLSLEVPAQHVLEQIVGKTGLPSWLLGISTRTVQGMAQLEVESALQDAKIRQLAMIPMLIKLFSVVLRLRGRSWNSITTDINKPGDWGIVFETPNIRDQVAQAQSRFLNAQADQMQTQSGITVNTPKTPPPKHAGKCSCGHDHIAGGGKMICGGKEDQRPTPWPALDDVEKGYEDRLKSDWENLRQQIFTIAKLTDADIAVGMQGMRGAKDGGDSFDFTDEQRAAVLDAMNGMIGEYSPQAADSPLKWYYGQAYSLGLIQAARMVGADRPLLDILKNREIFDQLAKTGFQLVRDNVTTAIQNQILNEMQAFVIAGSNPLSVASRLNKLFGDQNSSWERLARTEMSMAAEQAKVAEWEARGIDVRGAVIAGRDTHPRCRCANSVEEVDGKWKLVFVPAPDACPFCESLATAPG